MDSSQIDVVDNGAIVKVFLLEGPFPWNTPKRILESAGGFWESYGMICCVFSPAVFVIKSSAAALATPSCPECHFVPSPLMPHSGVARRYFFSHFVFCPRHFAVFSSSLSLSHLGYLCNTYRFVRYERYFVFHYLYIFVYCCTYLYIISYVFAECFSSLPY